MNDPAHRGENPAPKKARSGDPESPEHRARSNDPSVSADTSPWSRARTLTELLEETLSRRTFLGVALATVIGGSQGFSDVRGGTTRAGTVPTPPTGTADSSIHDPLTFCAIHSQTNDTVHVPPGYSWQSIARWGDPLHLGSPEFDFHNQNFETQSQQIGYNCDYVAFFPLSDGQPGAVPGREASDEPGSSSKGPYRYGRARAVRFPDGATRRGLLAINHETTEPHIMFPDYENGAPTRNQVDVEMAAHGLSVVEIARDPMHGWKMVRGSRFNRRVTVDTEMEITGPAAGHSWMKTSSDPSGTRVRGMLYNCAGGKTPWGTVLTCEENFHGYFAHRDSVDPDDPRSIAHTRYGLRKGDSYYRWEIYHDRFDVAKEPNEAFRFGWIVEIDPYDPSFMPRKHTALGRAKHEGAETTLSRRGHAVVYSGDDQRFDYVYKFVSKGVFDPEDRAANLELLTEGTLYVARFDGEGHGVWMPLIHGQGPLTSSNGFRSQADVAMKARLASDLLGATPMDRPEGFVASPTTGYLYLACTNNSRRTMEQTDAANPRAENRHGHILEIREADDDPGSTAFEWGVFLLAGDPDAHEDDGCYFAGFDQRDTCRISCPDNLLFDGAGNLWIATDGQPYRFETNDGLYAAPVTGRYRGKLRQFASMPKGAECTGPAFTPDGKTLFLSVQHPGAAGSMQEPQSWFPDREQPPRPTVIGIVKDDGGAIGA